MYRLLIRDHEELSRLLSQGDELLKEPRDGDALKRQRWRFDRWLTRHLHTLGTDLLPLLQHRQQPEQVERLESLSRQTEEMLAAYRRHKERFPLEEAASDWAGYSASGHDLMDRLRRLMQAQQDDLYPMIREVEGT